MTEEEGGLLTWVMRLSPMKAGMVTLSQNALGLSDPQQKEKVRVAISNSLDVLADAMVEERISALAQTFSADEIAGMLAFRHSATGTAYAKGSRALAVELSLIAPQDAASDAPAPAAEKLTLVHRLLMAEGVEPRLRRQVRALNAAMAEAVSASGLANKSTGGSAASAETDEETYVAKFMSATVRFDAETYSDEQLKELIAYFEGPTGRALIAKGPKLQSIAATRSVPVMEHSIALAGDAACQAIACDAAQHQKLNGVVSQVEKLLTASVTAQAR